MGQATTAECGAKRTLDLKEGRLEIDLTCQINMLERPTHTGNDGDPHRAPDYKDGVYIIYKWVNR